MTHMAVGDFDVKLNSLEIHREAAAATIGRRSIDKVFHGGKHSYQFDYALPR